MGATNVGSITLRFDDDLATNTTRDAPGQRRDRAFANLALERGDEVGFFRMGSTIVMVFETDPGFAFDVLPGQTVKLGQRLGGYPASSAARV